MKTLFVITTAALFLVTCASNHAAPSTNEPSVSASVSQSPVFSADTKARLKKIQDDYGLMAMSVQDRQIVVATSTGLISTEKMNAIKNAIHEVVGKDFTIAIIIK
jgi:uncharacterized protein YcfL